MTKIRVEGESIPLWGTSFSLPETLYVGGKKLKLGEEASGSFIMACWAECFAMFFFTVVCCGCKIVTMQQQNPNYFMIASSFGFGTIVISQIFQFSSGGYINTSIVLAMFLHEKVTFARVIYYFLFHILGSIFGSIVLLIIFGPKNFLFTVNSWSDNDFSAGQVFLAEVFCTAVVVFSVLAYVNSTFQFGGPLGIFSVGMSVLVSHLFLLPIDGCSLNPPRSFGPSLIASIVDSHQSHSSQQFVFWFGPIIGACLGVLFYEGYLSVIDANNIEQNSSDKLKRPFFAKIKRAQLTRSVKARLLERQLHSETNFLTYYRPYIVKDWKYNYFKYDRLKLRYKMMKAKESCDVLIYEVDFFNEIKRVDHFLGIKLLDCRNNILQLRNDWDKLDESEKKKYSADQDQRTLERTLRSIYEMAKNCENYHKLNCFLICKIAKKLEKLSSPSEKKSDFEVWKRFRSYHLYFSVFVKRKAEIDEAIQECVDVYSMMFRQSYPSLAVGELDYVKNKDLDRDRRRIEFGLKMGISFCLLVWTLTDSLIFEDNTQYFWSRPGLFVYSFMGSLILFKMLWAINIYAWSKYGVNYISLLQMSNNRPNSMLIMNESATLLLIYFMSLFIYYNLVTFKVPNAFIAPFLLIPIAAIYQGYKTLQYSGQKISRGLFTMDVFIACMKAPLITVTFRDNYAADALTSFTKVISDAIYTSCWVISGSFWNESTTDSYKSFGSSEFSCTSNNMKLVVSIVVIIPLWIRFLQCMRGVYDSGQLYPQFYNSLKYASSILVVIFGHFNPSTNSYLILINLATFYKWWWDVVMDWGLFSIYPHFDEGSLTFEGLFLRKYLMYPHMSWYYLGILIDLALRFLWVMSLAPETLTSMFVGPALGVFLGCMEIIRRSMWGHFRAENEHLKYVAKQSPGFLSVATASEKKHDMMLDKATNLENGYCPIEWNIEESQNLIHQSYETASVPS